MTLEIPEAKAEGIYLACAENNLIRVFALPNPSFGRAVTSCIQRDGDPKPAIEKRTLLCSTEENS
jgi:hypothetical protein